ncbi:acyltransferase [Pseudomonas viciae]|uniref:Acyltransferase n=1 Tax=Pseudomonas viciae TaxID=2505979 RepID=A0A4P7PHJ3_9PSED|nr:acyltransferase [Pseudomonas viciae]
MTMPIAPNGTRVSYSYRVEALDWQRGLLALSIMIYHLMFWHGETTTASSVIGRLGIYAVSMFFVLSGLSMAIAHERYELTIKSSIQFYIRRIFRIWPLLWLAIFAVTAKSLLLKNEDISIYKILLNLTTAFGFIEPSAYLNTGAWSIGNEMVYYALTPIILVIYRRSVTGGNILALASIAIGGVYALNLLTPAQPLELQWNTYIHPLNNLFFYVMGVAIYYNAKHLKPQLALPAACIFLSACIFAIFPSGSDNSSIVTSLNRLVFSSASVLMVFGFFKITPILSKTLSSPLERLGIITYGVYLLHPIVNSAVTMLFARLDWQLGAPTRILIISLATIAVANIAYELIEKPMIRLGKKLA